MKTYYKVYINDLDCDICVSAELDFLAEACSHYNWAHGMMDSKGHIEQYVKCCGIAKLVSYYNHKSIMHILDHTELTDELGYYFIRGNKPNDAPRRYIDFYCAFCTYQQMIEIDPSTCTGICRQIGTRTYECSVPELHGLYECQPMDLVHIIAEHARFLRSRIEDEITKLHEVGGSNATIDELESIIDSCRPELDCVDAHEEFVCKYGHDGKGVE